MKASTRVLLAFGALSLVLAIVVIAIVAFA